MRDKQTEWFFEKVVGCEYRYEEAVALESIDVDSITRQVSRTEKRNQDYVTGIVETIRLDGSIRPLILAPHGKRLKVLDGVHRILALRDAQHPTAEAYIVTATDDEQTFVAATVNVVLNGQGLSEHERRQHFLDIARTESPDLSKGLAVLRKQFVKRSCHVLAIAPATARKWIEVELFKSRAANLGLKLPPIRDGNHATGDKTDMWLQTVAAFNDEELLVYWPVLLTANTRRIGTVAKKLRECKSSHKRVELAAQLLSELNPTVRVMGQTQADKDRRNANSIRMNGAGVLKLVDEWPSLMAKYPDVGATLLRLTEALSDFWEAQTSDTEEPGQAQA